VAAATVLTVLTVQMEQRVGQDQKGPKDHPGQLPGIASLLIQQT
jgi:hypothetical protein